MKKTLIPFFLISLLFASCNDGSSFLDFFNTDESLSLESDFNRIEVTDNYSILIPKYMKENKELHENASLSYQNELKEVATIIMEDKKKVIAETLPFMDGFTDSVAFIENYVNVQLNLVAEGLEFPKNGNPELVDIDGNPAAQVWIEGHVEGMDVAYFITCIDAGDKVYFILSYTSKKKKEKFKDTFQKIGASFQIVDNTIIN